MSDGGTASQPIEPSPPATGGFLAEYAPPVVLVVVGLTAIAAVAMRFRVSSPMWLDEALSVNISKLPLHRIPGALKHDGHPPLYYVMLHGWMKVFGSTNTAIRAMSGAISLLTIPLAWLSGRRLGGRLTATTAALVFTMSPFVLRYGSEARMYSLILLEVFAGYLVLSASRERATPLRLAGVAVITAALLWTHYWSLWLLGAVGLSLLVVAWLQWRHQLRDEFRATATTVGAIIVGGLLFVPWLPTLLYQSQHTGTPWAPAFRPSTMIFTSFVEFGGGPYPEPDLLMLALVVLLVIGAMGRATSNGFVELDPRVRKSARPVLLTLGLTIVIACAVGVVTKMGFAPRYASVFFPLVVLLVALGIEAFPRGWARNGLLVGFALLSVAGLVVVYHGVRSQAGVVAAHVEQVAPHSLVVTCPDQLGPSVDRALAGVGDDVRSYPKLADPRFVNWVDYAQRNKLNDPAAAAKLTLAAAGNRTIVVAYRDDFRTLEGQCSAYVADLARSRPSVNLVKAATRYYEPMNAVEFPPTS